MNDVKIFNNEEFGEVRTVKIDNKPYFVGKDIANALGYSNSSKAVSTHCKSGIKKMLEVTDSQNGNVVKTLTTLIPEGDVYRLIVKSKLPSAEKFESWVMDEVLPSIRKNGGYIANQENLTSEQILANAVLVAQNVIAEKDKLLKEKEECIIEMKPKVEYHDEVLNKDGIISITVIAKDLGTTAAKLNKLMHDNRIIYKKGKSSTWCPYAEYEWLIEKGYADFQSYKVDFSSPVLKWTEKGRKWIIENYELWLENI